MGFRRATRAGGKLERLQALLSSIGGPRGRTLRQQDL